MICFTTYIFLDTNSSVIITLNSQLSTLNSQLKKLSILNSQLSTGAPLLSPSALEELRHQLSAFVFENARSDGAFGVKRLGSEL